MKCTPAGNLLQHGTGNLALCGTTAKEIICRWACTPIERHHFHELWTTRQRRGLIGMGWKSLIANSSYRMITVDAGLEDRVGLLRAGVVDNLLICSAPRSPPRGFNELFRRVHPQRPK